MHSSSNQILKETLNNNERSTNIKVFARFRPFNKMEYDLTKNGLGTDCCLFPDEQTVVLMPDSIVYTLDRVFNTSAT